MSLENELNEILENTDKVYTAGQSSIAETKMDKFGEVVPDIDGDQIVFDSDPTFIRMHANERDSSKLFFTPQVIVSLVSSDDGKLGITQNNKGLLITNNDDIFNTDEGLFFTPQGETIAGTGAMISSNSPLEIKSNESLDLKVGENVAFVINQETAALVKLDKENLTDEFLPICGVTTQHSNCYVTVEYLESRIASLEARIAKLEGNAE